MKIEDFMYSQEPNSRELLTRSFCELAIDKGLAYAVREIVQHASLIGNAELEPVDVRSWLRGELEAIADASHCKVHAWCVNEIARGKDPCSQDD
jgi:hypothetical protein